MIKKDSSFFIKPIDIDENTWYYHERKGICVVRQIKNKQTKELVQVDMFYLPWNKLYKSVEQYKINKKTKKSKKRKTTK